MVEQFESALAIQAFAQHYLQDSFAAGHMGFNRIASSNAAALTYHNQMSKVGRCIASELSDVWYTFGDDHLYQSSDGAEHVMAAAASSFHDFLFAFVTGDINTLGWQDVWSQLPAYFNETATTPEQCQPGGAWQPLRSVSKPANAASTFEVATVTDAAIYRPAARGLLFGSSYELAPIQVGYRVIQSRVFGGMGLTTRELGNTALLLDLGFLWHVGTSTAGTVTHEVGYGEYMYFEIKHGSWRGISFRAFYAANFEAGRVYLRFQTGAAYSYGRWAPHVSTGIGWVRMAGR